MYVHVVSYIATQHIHIHMSIDRYMLNQKADLIKLIFDVCINEDTYVAKYVAIMNTLIAISIIT